jgi:hypothetical protein
MEISSRKVFISNLKKSFTKRNLTCLCFKTDGSQLFYGDKSGDIHSIKLSSQMEKTLPVFVLGHMSFVTAIVKKNNFKKFRLFQMMESTLFLQKVVKLSGLVFFQNVKVWISVLTLISRNSKHVDGS